MPYDTTGLFMVRAWMEDGSDRPLRATIRLTTDVRVGIEREFTLTDGEDVCRAVQEWLDHLVTGGAGGPAPS